MSSPVHLCFKVSDSSAKAPIEVSKADLNKLGLYASVLGHIGDGNFHESILYDGKDEAQCESVRLCVRQMVERALEMDGTCSGEHGIGLGKKEYLVKEVGNEAVEVMRSIKSALDPQWLMNPGKIFDVV